MLRALRKQAKACKDIPKVYGHVTVVTHDGSMRYPISAMYAFRSQHEILKMISEEKEIPKEPLEIQFCDPANKEALAWVLLYIALKNHASLCSQDVEVLNDNEYVSGFMATHHVNFDDMDDEKANNIILAWCEYMYTHAYEVAHKQPEDNLLWRITIVAQIYDYPQLLLECASVVARFVPNKSEDELRKLFSITEDIVPLTKREEQDAHTAAMHL